MTERSVQKSDLYPIAGEVSQDVGTYYSWLHSLENGADPLSGDQSVLGKRWAERTTADRMTDNAWDRYYCENANDPQLFEEFGHVSDRFNYVIRELEKRRVETVVDAACGIGRHTKVLLDHGFQVRAFDLSAEAISIALQANPEFYKAIAEGRLTIEQFDMCEPWPESFREVDAVLGMQAIYHCTRSELVNLLRHLREHVLKPGGVLAFSASKRKERALLGDHPSENGGDFIVLEDGTHIPLKGREKGLPHYYLSWGEIPILLRDEVGFEDISVYDWNGAGYFFIYGFNTKEE